MWGTANPINATGPQKAVVAAVRIPVARSSRFLVLLIFTPKFSAYLFPNSMALRGLMSKIAMNIPIKIRRENSGSCSIDTPPKFPSPHIVYECTPSAVAKKFNNDMMDEVIYPIMIPAIKSMMLLLIIVDRNRITAIISEAPKVAPIITAKKPDIDSV